MAGKRKAAPAGTPLGTPPRRKSYEVRPGQSIELLQELHILTRDGRMNQDSRRKLKQVYHLFNFIEPLLREAQAANPKSTSSTTAPASRISASSSTTCSSQRTAGRVVHLGYRDARRTGHRARQLAARLGFAGMRFQPLRLPIRSPRPNCPRASTSSPRCMPATPLPTTRSASRWPSARAIVLVPCCQAEVAATLRKHKAAALAGALGEVWRHRSTPASSAAT